MTSTVAVMPEDGMRDVWGHEEQWQRSSRSGVAIHREGIETGRRGMDIFNLNELLSQLVLALGAALVLGNGYALIQARRGNTPKGIEGEIHRGRAWWLITVGLVIAVWGLGSLIAA
jgi:hypothetical protein